MSEAKVDGLIGDSVSNVGLVHHYNPIAEKVNVNTSKCLVIIVLKALVKYQVTLIA